MTPEKLNLRTGICRKHGPFEIYDYLCPDSEMRTFGACVKCEQEKINADAEKEATKLRKDKIEKLISIANIPKRFAGKTFNDYEAKEPRQVAVLETIKRYAEEFEENLRQGRCMIWTGGPGAGKTHLASCLTKAIIEKTHFKYEAGRYSEKMELVEHEFFAHYTTEYSLLQNIKQTWRRDAEDTEIQAISKYTRPDLLIIDEVGVCSSETDKNLFYQVVNSRYEKMLPTVLISNLNEKDLTAYAGLRVIDRMKENSGFNLIFDWESHRK